MSELGPRSLVRLSLPPARWLARAFGIFGDDPPSELEPTISPVLDVVQGGWGQVRWSTFVATRTTNGITNIIDPADDQGPALVYCSAIATAGSAASSGQYSMVNAIGGIGMAFFQNTFSSLGQAYSHTQIAAGPAPLVIPAGYQFYWQSFDLSGTGASHLLRCVVGRFPVGVKPW